MRRMRVVRLGQGHVMQEVQHGSARQVRAEGERVAPVGRRSPALRRALYSSNLSGSLTPLLFAGPSRLCSTTGRRRRAAQVAKVWATASRHDRVVQHELAHTDFKSTLQCVCLNHISYSSAGCSRASFAGSSVASSSAPPRRTVPPPLLSTSPATPSQSLPTSSETATLLYPYEAQSSFELSVEAGAVVEVVDPEDENGWVKVRVPADGRVGLVPASYIQLGGAVGNGSATAAVSGGSGGQKGASRFRGLWRYSGLS